MTSATLIYSPPHLNEIPPQKRGLKHPSYTTTLPPLPFLPGRRVGEEGGGGGGEWGWCCVCWVRVACRID